MVLGTKLGNLCVCACEIQECLIQFDLVQLARADMAANTSESFVFLLNAPFETQKLLFHKSKNKRVN